MDDIDKIFRNSSKAELIEVLNEKLVDADKVIVVLIEDKDEGKYASTVMTLGLEHTYEALGILDVARRDLIEDDY